MDSAPVMIAVIVYLFAKTILTVIVVKNVLMVVADLYAQLEISAPRDRYVFKVSAYLGVIMTEIVETKCYVQLSFVLKLVGKIHAGKTLSV